MACENLADFLKEKTGKELLSDGNCLSDRRASICIKNVSQEDSLKIKGYIPDFYLQNGYIESDLNKKDDFGLIFRNERHSKGVVFSYFGNFNEVLITSITIGPD